MQWIVDELFVGNHLAAGNIRSPEGAVIDLRVIKSPIVVFCSRGGNITPPQQPLDWILTSMTASMTFVPGGRPTCTRSTTMSVIWASSSRARWRARNMTNSLTISI